MPELSSSEAVQKSTAKSAGGSASADDFIKLEASATYVAILKGSYEEAYEHWCGSFADKSRKGKKVRVVCSGGIDSAGWSPDTCKICAVAADRFERKKAAKADNDEALAAELNSEGLSIRASYKAFLYAAKGTAVVERKNGKKIETHDFDDFDGKPRILSLSASQWKLLTSLINNAEFPDITSGSDLVGKVLKFEKKEKTGKTGTYNEVVSIRPVGEITLKVTGKYPDLTEQITVNPADVAKALAVMSGAVVEEDASAADDSEVDVDAAVAKAKARKAEKAGTKKKGSRK